MAETARNAERLAALANRPQWQKLGIYERLWTDPDGPTYQARSVASHLLRYARTIDEDPRAIVDIEEPRTPDPTRKPSLSRALRMAPNTVEKYVKELVRLKLVEARRDRPNGGVTFYLRGLTERYRDDRFRKDCGTVTVLPTVPVPQISTPVPQIAVAGSANFDAGSAKIAVLIEHVDHVFISSEHTALARRLGLDSDFFAHRPMRYGAALLVASTLEGWGLTGRRIRKLMADYRWHGVHRAVGFVIEQLEHQRERSLLSVEDRKRLDLPLVDNPAALFEYAIAHECVGVLPGFEDDPESPHGGGSDSVVDLWTYLREMIRRRVSPGTYELGFKPTRMRCEDGTLVFVAVNDAAAIVARKAEPVVARCLERIGYRHDALLFTSEEKR